MSDLTVPQGTTYTATAQLRVDEVPVDLTGFQARMQIRNGRSKQSALICDLTEANGRITVSDGPNGMATITLDSVTTAELDPGTYYFDIEAFDTSSPPVVYRVAEGTVLVTPEITD